MADDHSLALLSDTCGAAGGSLVAPESLFLRGQFGPQGHVADDTAGEVPRLRAGPLYVYLQPKLYPAFTESVGLLTEASAKRPTVGKIYLSLIKK